MPLACVRGTLPSDRWKERPLWNNCSGLQCGPPCSLQHDGHAGETPGGRERLRWVAPETDIDPVCGKTVHTDKAKSAMHDGTVYYFRSSECRDRFEAAPQTYVKPM
jgi:YHS domain-containing protein